LLPEERWAPRHRTACVFCARLHWREEIQDRFISGPKCFMHAADKVWKFFSVERYRGRWPLIPEEELRASAVNMGSKESPVLVLLHKRRVPEAARNGSEPVPVCDECFEAFSPQTPWLCRYALPNDLWWGRFDPLLRAANLAHELCLALARAVAMKVVLRPSGSSGVAPAANSDTSKWDFLFHQSGYVGSAVLFHNGDAKEAIGALPPQKLNDAFAITICKDLPAEKCTQEQGKEMVSKIADLKLDRPLYEQQYTSLQKTNPVYQAGPQLDQDVLTRWCPDPAVPVVPPPVAESVVTVPVQGVKRPIMGAYSNMIF
jgi:hypothetical protein